jgi:hypothetical protein
MYAMLGLEKRKLQAIQSKSIVNPIDRETPCANHIIFGNEAYRTAQSVFKMVLTIPQLQLLLNKSDLLL